MAFGMDNMMSNMYGGQKPPAKPANLFAKQPTVDETPVKNSRSPHQSMADMMHLVEDMYQPQQSQTTQLVTADGSDQSTSSAVSGHTRNSQQSGDQNCGDGEQTKQAFKAWVQSFDKMVAALDQSDKVKGDQVWKDVVACVDDCWKQYTEQGKVP